MNKRTLGFSKRIYSHGCRKEEFHIEHFFCKYIEHFFCKCGYAFEAKTPGIKPGASWVNYNKEIKKNSICPKCGNSEYQHLHEKMERRNRVGDLYNRGYSYFPTGKYHSENMKRWKIIGVENKLVVEMNFENIKVDENNNVELSFPKVSITFDGVSRTVTALYNGKKATLGESIYKMYSITQQQKFTERLLRVYNKSFPLWKINRPKLWHTKFNSKAIHVIDKIVRFPHLTLVWNQNLPWKSSNEFFYNSRATWSRHLNLNATSPAEILKITKGELRYCRDYKKHQNGLQSLSLWRIFQETVPLFGHDFTRTYMDRWCRMAVWQIDIWKWMKEKWPKANIPAWIMGHRNFLSLQTSMKTIEDYWRMEYQNQLQQEQALNAGKNVLEDAVAQLDMTMRTFNPNIPLPSPANIVQAHNRAARDYDLTPEEIEKQKAGFDAVVEKYKYLNGKISEKSQYSFEVADSYKMLRKESKELHHCVHSYYGYMARGECVLVLMRKNGKPHVTIELRNRGFDTDSKAFSSTVVQARADHNENPTPFSIHTIKKWCEKHSVSKGIYSQIVRGEFPDEILYYENILENA